MKLIDEKEVEEVAKSQHIANFNGGTQLSSEFNYGFTSGVNFAEHKLLPMMVEFSEWCFRYDRINRNHTFTTEQLLEQFLKTRTK